MLILLKRKINEKVFDKIRDTNYLLDTDLVAPMEASFLRLLNEYSGNTFTKSAFDIFYKLISWMTSKRRKVKLCFLTTRIM